MKKTTTDFINEAKEIHGNKYDYSKVEYKNCYTKVCIICPIHGEFWQQPREHLKGNGCQICGKNTRRLSLDGFITKAKEIHGNKYDYSKVDYINTHTKVCIICLEHGEFWQTPAHHLKGQGCPKCYRRGGKTQKMSTEEFIEKARQVHGDKYDYSKVEYVNSKTKVCIICPEHGEFWQTSSEHLQGYGCIKCANESYKNDIKLIINKANIIHNNKYDYSKYEYINSHTKSIIICPIHGEFLMDMRNHIRGRGCPKCGKSQRKTTEQFIKEAKQVHGDKYDYSKVEYKNQLKEISIICPKHGEFKQKPVLHLTTCGCPKCAKEINVNETKLFDFLCKNFPNIEIIHSYHDYKKLNKYEIDIYIPKYKIGIEYQGMQHFKSVDFFGGEKSYLHQVFNDKNKKRICEELGIHLLHFSYLNITSEDYDLIKDETILIEKIKGIMNQS